MRGVMMGKILQFPTKSPSKFGFQRVKKTKKPDPKRKPGQLNLFAKPDAQIIALPLSLSPFEEALLLDERDEEKAKSAYKKAISSSDCVADAYCNLGILESKSGDTFKAFDCFTHSLKHDSRHLESHYNLANLYFDSGDLRMACLHYQLAGEIEPGFPNVYFNLGLVHAMNDNFTEAAIALDKYKELTSDEEGSKADELLKSIKLTMTGQ